MSGAVARPRRRRAGASPSGRRVPSWIVALVRDADVATAKFALEHPEDAHTSPAHVRAMASAFWEGWVRSGLGMPKGAS